MIDVNLSGLLDNPNTVTEYRITIHDPTGAVVDTIVPADGIVQLSTEHAIFADGLSVGNVYEGGAEITLDGVGIPAGADVNIDMRLVAGATVSDWIPWGRYRLYDKSTTTDGLVYAAINDRIQDTEIDIMEAFPDQTYPVAMSTMLAQICAYLGIDMDARSVVSSDMLVQEPGHISMRQVMGYIASAHGGNIYITRDGKLRLLPLKPANSTPVQNVANAVVSCLEQNTPVEITGVRVYVSDELYYRSGSESGTVVTITNPWGTQAMADCALANMSGFTFAAYEAENAFVSPALELGDCVTICGTAVMIARIESTDDLLYCPTLSLPSLADASVTYPYQGTMATAIRQLTRIMGNMSVAGTLISEGLYASLGDIADLTVAAVSTHQKIKKYVEQDTTDIRYVEIHGQEISVITGSVVWQHETGSSGSTSTPKTEQLTTQAGLPLYWDGNIDDAEVVNGHYEIDGAQVVTTRKVTEWPVTVYAYDESNKVTVSVDDNGHPYISMTSGQDSAGKDTGQATITHTADGLQIKYATPDGQSIAMTMGNDGAIEMDDALTEINLSTIEETGKFLLKYGGSTTKEYGLVETDTGYNLTTPEGTVISIVT